MSLVQLPCPGGTCLWLLPPCSGWLLQDDPTQLCLAIAAMLMPRVAQSTRVSPWYCCPLLKATWSQVDPILSCLAQPLLLAHLAKLNLLLLLLLLLLQELLVLLLHDQLLQGLGALGQWRGLGAAQRAMPGQLVHRPHVGGDALTCHQWGLAMERHCQEGAQRVRLKRGWPQLKASSTGQWRQGPEHLCSTLAMVLGSQVTSHSVL